MTMDPSARRQVLSVAAEVNTSSAREAAIVGGLVRSTFAAGHIDIDSVARHARALMHEFDLRDVDRSAPGGAEIAMVLDRFEHGRRRLPWPPPERG
jgi:hypothetical protein